MLLEIIGAVLLAILVLWLVFEPAWPGSRPVIAIPEPEAPEETRRGQALLALKEIDFDRETGKLSDTDYRMLKARYTAEAVAALEAEAATAPAPPGDPEELVSARLQLLRSARSPGSPESIATASTICPRCGPRPESDARFCSRCGLSLAGAGFCTACGAALTTDSRYCGECGVQVAA